MHFNGKTIFEHNSNDFGQRTSSKNKYSNNMENSVNFGGHLENMQIRSIRRHFSALDSAYQITPNRGVKPFSSQSACT